jgi:hypothetical protein
MNNLLRYSNGVGHLIMSIFMTLIGLSLILIPGINVAAQGVGIGIILAVQAAWFIPGAARQAVNEVVKQSSAPQGVHGIQGVQGVQGEQGTQGIQGIQGPPTDTLQTNGGNNHG